MKKFILTLLIIGVICAIGYVYVSGKSDKNSVEAENTVATTTEEYTTEAYTEAEFTEAATVDVLSDNVATGSIEEVSTEFPECFDLELEIMLQNPELPAGCESVSLTMILNYLGYDLGKTDIVDNYLVYSSNFVMGYYGDPYSSTTGGGCYAPGMTTTANNFLSAMGSDYTAENITGTDFDVLLEYVADGYPILIWSTISMIPNSKGYYEYDEEGNAYAWDYNEHCVVLTGFDFKANTVTIYDPIDGVVYRDMDDFEYLYENMDRMAVIIR